jgi:transcriptional regulator
VSIGDSTNEEQGDSTMYIPPPFAETDRTRLFEAIERYSFGLLVSQDGGSPVATHLPLLLDRSGGEQGRLLGHMARANPHWRTLAGQQVLCVFSGPHAYISPSWYEAEHVVPTWNYVAVHAYGTCRLLEDDADTRTILSDYVTTYERSLSEPWTLDTGTNFFQKMAEMVVGFEIVITRLEGKWKLGQNHPRERREKTARRLAEQGDENSQQIARLMRETLEARNANE